MRKDRAPAFRSTCIATKRFFRALQGGKRSYQVIAERRLCIATTEYTLRESWKFRLLLRAAKCSNNLQIILVSIRKFTIRASLLRILASLTVHLQLSVAVVLLGSSVCFVVMCAHLVWELQLYFFMLFPIPMFCVCGGRESSFLAVGLGFLSYIFVYCDFCSYVAVCKANSRKM